MNVAIQYAKLPNMWRKVNLKKWFNCDKKKPRKGQNVWICDASWDGWAEYELPAIFDGTDYFFKDWSGPVAGMSYWKPRR